jgi:hypothetical protein
VLELSNEQDAETRPITKYKIWEGLQGLKLWALSPMKKKMISTISSSDFRLIYLN